MASYPVDSATVRERAELDDDSADDWLIGPPPKRIPMPPEIAEQIRRTLADKRAHRDNTE